MADKKLVALVKKNPDATVAEAGEVLGKPASVTVALELYKAELEAHPSLKVPSTVAGVREARKKSLSWYRISAYSGSSVAVVKKLAEGDAKASAPVQRGRKTSENGKKATAAAKGAKGAKATTGARRGRPPGAKTLAERRASRPNPS